MNETFDAALEALRRRQFATGMADAERRLRADPVRWAEYRAEQNEWLTANLG